MDWQNLLTYQDHRILELIEDEADSYHNPICDAAKDGRLKAALDIDISIRAITRLATICQMMIYDRIGGPDEDGERKALRRSWYSWFKVYFALPFSLLLGQDNQDDQWGKRWFKYQSIAYADLVDKEEVTYRQLWVNDDSRMMQDLWEKLFRGMNIVLCVEKDSLMGDFVAAAKALGCKAIYSGKGKSSKAAIEKLLRTMFGWYEGYDPFDYDSPLYVLSISDFDYDGHIVIAPTFAEQCRRYTRHIKEARVGLTAEQVQDAGYDLQERWYEVKQKHKSSKKWAKEHGVKTLDCLGCNVQFISNRAETTCPQCGAETLWTSGPAYGYEVEAMRTRQYYPLIINALLRLIDFDDIVIGLRDDCRADSFEAAERVAQEALEGHPDYAELQAQLEDIQSRMEDWRNRVQDFLHNEGEPHEADWRDEEDDPAQSELYDYVQDSTRFSLPWRPFSQDLRTENLAQFLRDNYEDDISNFQADPL